MSQLDNLSQIENNFYDESFSQIHLSFEHPFSNYLEPNELNTHDTRRFPLQQSNAEILNTATPKQLKNMCRPRFPSNSSSRARSVKSISRCSEKSHQPMNCSQGRLVKRVENLERKQEQWRERAGVWHKERKSFRRAIENVSLDPAEYYRDQLQNWKNSKFLKKVSDDLTMNPLQEIKNMCEWINSQPESITFKSIRQTFVMIYDKLADLEDYIKKAQGYEEKLKEAEVAIQKNADYEEALDLLRIQLEDKTLEISNLQSKVIELEAAKENKLISSPVQSEQELLLLKLKQLETHHSEDRQVLELTSDLEEKSYEILMAKTEIARLSSALDQSNIANNFYIKTIHELKEKLKALRLFEAFPQCSAKPSVDSQTQTPRIPSRPKSKPSPDLLAYTFCMASALEALLHT